MEDLSREPGRADQSQALLPTTSQPGRAESKHVSASSAIPGALARKLAGIRPAVLRRLAAIGALVAGLAVLKVTAFAPALVPVRVVAVARGRVEQTVTNSRAGTVKARRRAELSPEVGGRVASLPYRAGARVRQGVPLLRIDDALPRVRLRVAERELAAAQAQREQACFAAERAHREFERHQALALDGIVSTDVLDASASAERTARAACRAAAAGAERAVAALALARTDLGKYVLMAPFPGVVAKLSIEVGEWTTPSPPGLPIPAVIDLIDTSSIYVSAPMDEVDSARIHAGQDARITVDSHPGRAFPGRVVRVAPYVLDVEAQNRTVEVEAEFLDAGVAATLLPGTSADVEVILSVREGVPRIPTAALLEGGKLLVVEGGRLVERAVTAGVRNWDVTEVLSGAAPGELVVTSLDRPEVKAGARVRVSEAGP